METLGLMHFPLELKAGRIQSLEARMEGGTLAGVEAETFIKHLKEIPRSFPSEASQQIKILKRQLYGVTSKIIQALAMNVPHKEFL